MPTLTPTAAHSVAGGTAGHVGLGHGLTSPYDAHHGLPSPSPHGTPAMRPSMPSMPLSPPWQHMQQIPQQQQVPLVTPPNQQLYGMSPQPQQQLPTGRAVAHAYHAAPARVMTATPIPLLSHNTPVAPGPWCPKHIQDLNPTLVAEIHAELFAESVGKAEVTAAAKKSGLAAVLAAPAAWPTPSSAPANEDASEDSNKRRRTRPITVACAAIEAHYTGEAVAAEAAADPFALAAAASVSKADVAGAESKGEVQAVAGNSIVSAGAKTAKTAGKKQGKKLPKIRRKKSSITCGYCDACMVDDCGSCASCKDMPRFGGGHNMRKKCVNRPPCLVKGRHGEQSTITAQMQSMLAKKKAKKKRKESGASQHVCIKSAVAASASDPSDTSKSVVSVSKTDDEIKKMAQSAVNDLIASACEKSSQDASSSVETAVVASVSDPAGTSRSVDTSSARIAALTSSKWAAAFSESIDDARPGWQQAAHPVAPDAAVGASDPAVSKAARARRANPTPDELAREKRDRLERKKERNKEHARNTRLRKKAYVEELQSALTELVAQRDASELEHRRKAESDLEDREVRFHVMEEFLKLRGLGGNSPDLLSRWEAIMVKEFTLTLPRTEYRTIGQRRSNNGMEQKIISIDQNELVLQGASEVMANALNLSAFINSLGNGVDVVGSSPPIRLDHDCDRKKFMMDGVNATLEWTASTAGAIEKGAPAELVMNGTMRATFSPSNKLVCAELRLFDTNSAFAKKFLIAPPPVKTTTQILSASLPGREVARVLSTASLDGTGLCDSKSSDVSTSVASSEKGGSSSDNESVDGTTNDT